jgi:HlyD family secretion protein
VTGRKNILPVVALLALFPLACANQGKTPGRVAVIEQQDLVLDVEVSGTLKSLESEALGAPGNVTRTREFKITQMVAEAAQVKAGEEVIAFDPSDLEKKLEDAESELDKVVDEIEKVKTDNSHSELDARITLEQADSDRRKAELKAEKPLELTPAADLKKSAIDKLLAEHTVTLQQDKEQARLRLTSANLAIQETRRSRAQARVEELQAQIKSMSIKCTRSGTVIYKVNGRGEKKKAGDRVGRGEVVLEIAALDKMAAQGQVDELYAGHVAVGQKVRLRLEAHPDREYAGVIERAAPLVRTESAESRIKILQLDIKFLQTESLLMRPGMRFRGYVELMRVPGVVQVPLAAIQTTATGPVVDKLTVGGATELTAVKLGRRSRESVEVLSGLKPGDRIFLQSSEQEATSGSHPPQPGAT